MRTFTIEARRWFQESYGNTYHSVRVYDESGKLIGENPFEYGYGCQYLETARVICHKHMKAEEYNMIPVLGETYDVIDSVTDVKRKKDL